MLGSPDRELALPASPAPHGVLANLRRALALEFPQITADKSALAFGIPSLDAALGGGLATGALHEIAAAREAEIPAATGFALILAARNRRRRHRRDPHRHRFSRNAPALVRGRPRPRPRAAAAQHAGERALRGGDALPRRRGAISPVLRRNPDGVRSRSAAVLRPPHPQPSRSARSMDVGVRSCGTALQCASGS